MAKNTESRTMAQVGMIKPVGLMEIARGVNANESTKLRKWNR